MRALHVPAAGEQPLGLVPMGWFVVAADAAIVNVAVFSLTIAATVSSIPARLVPDAGGGVGTMVRLGFVPGVAALGALFAYQAAVGAARSTTAFDHVAFTVAALVGAAAVVGVLRPRTARRGGGMDR